MRLAEQGDDVSAHVRTHQAIGSAVIETDSLQPRSAMAIYATQAKRVSDQMFIEAASAVADQVSPELLKQGLLYPLQSNILETEIKTAARVAKLVFDSKLAQVDRPADMEAFIRSHVYKPEYKKLV